MYKLVSFLFILAMILSSCNDSSDLSENDCDTKISFEAYVNLESQCRVSKYESVDQITENLIGQWQLVGIRSGWVDTLFYDCITLDIDEENIVLRNLDTGEVVTTEWEIETYEVNVYTVIYLKTDESFTFNPTEPNGGWIQDRMGMETFSENFMYGTGRVDDGSSYLYERIQ